MAAAIKKVPAAKKDKAKTKVKAEVKKKAAKAPVAKKTKIQVKAKAKAVKATAKAVAKKKVTETKKAKVTVKAKAVKAPAAKRAKAKTEKAVVIPSKKKAVPQKKAVAKKPEKKALTSRKSTAAKKGTVAVAPAADRFRGLKGMLIAKRDALLKEAKLEIQKYVSGENRQLVDTAIDEADWAAVEISEDINLKRLGAQRQLLKDVEECLRKVNEGTYGICEDCAEEISEKRLHVIPTASLCIDCKEQREKMAILDQDTEI
ncbi:MAG: TraR/DksA C4-type zinc finger protein [Nitrospirota bacterium]|nr:TraR/DksA C4-type zinc finger protein [Nitrospirota bacterium]